ncbi:bromodomain-containing protein 2 [Drosophila obscura]|uniref:bromodomain-containing protein 2 n=1 Tax=Drosophila obscura TaxID=7282 RepID=UPI001BB0F979|nr:bromodomain-containing protein 2 [Drosophila obscura]
MCDRNRNRKSDRNRSRARNQETFPGSNACKAIIRKLFSSQYKRLAWIFYEPIDAPFLGLHDYYNIVERPIDLRFIKNRLYNGLYWDAAEFERDMQLLFHNTYLYTTPGHLCYEMAKKLQVIFEAMFVEITAPVTPAKSDTTIETTPQSTMSPIFESEEDTSKPGTPNTPHKDGDGELLQWQHAEAERPWTAKEDDDRPWTTKDNNMLAARLQTLKGEVLHRVMHIIKQMEDLRIVRRKLKFDTATLKSHTKYTIVRYLASKGVHFRRRARSTFNKSTYNNCK